MARGFESKDVEYQQAEAERRREHTAPVSAADQERARRRADLELTRARVRDDLRRVTSPVHRIMLERALAALDEQLTAL